MKDFSSEILKADQLSCGCSSEDGDTLPWEGRKCWYPERRNSRSIHPSTQATSNIELKTSKNISTDSTLLVENSFSTACGEKKVYKISILDRKSFNSKASSCRPRLSLLLLSLATPMLCLLTPRHGPIFAGLGVLSEKLLKNSVMSKGTVESDTLLTISCN